MTPDLDSLDWSAEFDRYLDLDSTPDSRVFLLVAVAVLGSALAQTAWCVRLNLNPHRSGFVVAEGPATHLIPVTAGASQVWVAGGIHWLGRNPVDNLKTITMALANELNLLTHKESK